MYMGMQIESAKGIHVNFSYLQLPEGFNNL